MQRDLHLLLRRLVHPSTTLALSRYSRRPPSERCDSICDHFVFLSSAQRAPTVSDETNLMEGLDSPSRGGLEGEEEITAAVEADIERNTARILRDYPLASLTPYIDYLEHFPPPAAPAVRSWPQAAAPSPLPTFTNDNAPGYALLQAPYRNLPQAHRGYVDANLRSVQAIMQETLASHSTENLRFKDVARFIPDDTVVPLAAPTEQSSVGRLMHPLPLPRPSPASGHTLAGQPVASSSRQLLETYIKSIDPALVATPEKPAPHINGMQTPSSSPHGSHKRRHSGVEASSRVAVVIPPYQPPPMTASQKARVLALASDPFEDDLQEQAPQIAPAGDASVHKLQQFLEDCFEAEDSFSADMSIAHAAIGSPIFVASSDMSENEPPVLSPIAIRHLLKLIRQVVKAQLLPRVQIDHLARLLKVLERSVKRGEDVDAIPSGMKVRSQVQVSTPTKPKSKPSTPRKTPAKRTPRIRKAATKSGSADIDGDETDELSEEDPKDAENFTPSKESQSQKSLKKARRGSVPRSPSVGRVKLEEQEEKPTMWGDDALDRFQDDLRSISESLAASEVVLAVLSGASLPKHLYSEELVSGIFAILKQQLDELVYPCIEAAADIEDGKASHLAQPLREGPSKSLLTEVFRLVGDVLPLATNLVEQEDLPESIVVPAVVIAIGPFFVDTPTQWASVKKGKSKELFGSSTLKAIQVPALSLLRLIFAKYADQRSWIVEEIVNSLTKLSDVKKAKRQYSLRNGASIHNVSALLLHLVQSTAHGVEDGVRAQLLRDEAPEVEAPEPSTSELKTAIHTARGPVKTSTESASIVANSLIKLLLERSKTSVKSSSDADYKAVFENLMTDLLTVADLAEWPVANFLLHVCLRRMFSAMDTKQSSVDLTVLRTLAIDQLGNVGSKLCERRKQQTSDGHAPLLSLGRIIRKGDEPELRRLVEAQQRLVGKLQQWSTEDSVSETASQFIGARWASDLIRAIDKVNADGEETYDDRDEMLVDRVSAEKLLPTLEAALRAVFADRRDRQRLTPTLQDEDGPSSMQAVAVDLAWSQGQADTFEALLKRILDVLQTSEAATQRSKSLRALDKIVEKDPSIFMRDDVRQAIEQRFRDTQPSVRDAAFDLLGTYVVNDAELAEKYLPRIADRITDTGLSVRKRVIKLLKSIYGIMAHDEMQQTEICRRLCSRVKDDDDGIKDLAVAAMEDIWFSTQVSPRKPASKTKKAAEDDVDQKPLSASDKHALLKRSQVLINLAGTMRDRGSYMEEMLKLILDKYAESPKNMTVLKSSIREIVDALVEALTEPMPSTAIDKVACAKALDIFLAADPSALSISRADSLSPYLQVSASAAPEELAVREHLLRVFHVCLPHMPSTALTFATKFEASMLELLKRPPMQQSSLVELVGSYCAAVRHHTHAYDRMSATFKRFLTAAQASADNFLKTASPEVDSRALMTVNLLARVVALLCEQADFDAVRLLSDEAKAAVDTISPAPVARLTSDWLMSLYLQKKSAGLRSNAMLCLGFLFRAFPTMMLEPAATTMMDDVFGAKEGDAEQQARLLDVIQDFLQQQADKNTDSKQGQSSKKPKQVDVDMKELIGNTDSFADSGVSSAIVQRHLSHILRAAESLDINIRTPAVDILGFTVRQGLAHPLESLRTIVALETGPDISISKRMVALHSTLHTKHADLVHSRFLECARGSFDYNVAVATSREKVRGHRRGPPPVALFEPWYALLREKRKWKLDFIKGLLRAFVVDVAAGRCSQTDIDFARYVGENLAALDYKTQEEVFACVSGLDKLIGTTGTQLSHLLEERLDADAAMDEDDGASGNQKAVGNASFLSLIRASQVLSIALMLRDHLKARYKVTDTKLTKYTPGKKSPAGDKAAVATEGISAILTYDKLPLAISVLSDDDVERPLLQARSWTETVSADAAKMGGDDEEDD